MREAIEGHGGHVFTTEPDGFRAAFATAASAAEAAVQAQRKLRADATIGFAVRMGLHTAEAVEQDGSYSGSEVNRAGRLTAHLLGFTGPKAEAEEIKQRLARFLRDELKLEMSADKTLITHARTQKARFLGYDIIAQHSATRPAVNGVIGLRVPRDVITARQAPYLSHGGRGRKAL